MHTTRITYVYTDGSAINNLRRGTSKTVGGIGVFFGDDDPRNVSEPFFEFPITNNRTEIKAATRAIDSFMRDKMQRGDQSKEKLVIYTDSQYLINLITKWIHKWKHNQWKTAEGKDVLNKDLIYQLDHIILLYKEFVEVEFKYAPAHRNEPRDKKSLEHKLWYYNMRADQLAKRGSFIAKMAIRQ